MSLTVGGVSARPNDLRALAQCAGQYDFGALVRLD